MVACRLTSVQRCLVTGEAQPAIHLPAGGKTGFLLQGLIEFDRISQQLGDIGIGAQLADQACSVECGARGKLVLFQ